MTHPDKMWTRCMLEGAELDAAVARCRGVRVVVDDGKCYFTARELYHLNGRYSPAGSWHQGGPIIEENEIFLDPPHDSHVTGGPNQGWHRSNYWSATVSSRVRTYPHPNREPGVVGRGIGPTPLIAAMRAFVASFGGL